MMPGVPATWRNSLAWFEGLRSESEFSKPKPFSSGPSSPWSWQVCPGTQVLRAAS